MGQTGQNLWDAVQCEFHIDDCGGLELLFQACAAADRAEELSAQIDRDGEVIRAKSGLKSHPALRDELACRAFICRTIQRLGINLEAIKPRGRPAPVIHWDGES